MLYNCDLWLRRPSKAVFHLLLIVYYSLYGWHGNTLFKIYKAPIVLIWLTSSYHFTGLPRVITASLLMWILTSHRVESSQGKCFYWGFESLSQVSSAEIPAEYPNKNSNNRFLSFPFPSCPACFLFPSPQPPLDTRKHLWRREVLNA